MKKAVSGVSGRRGFTLIELMIVVAVVALLASIALPAYNDSIRKSRRAQAKADLVEYAQLAERHFTSNGSYANFDTELDLPVQSPREGGTARYGLAYASTATTFTIPAPPSASQSADRCGTLSLNQAGQKTKTGGAPLSECW